MRKRLAKERRKMLISILAIFLVISFAVSFFYVVVTYSLEKEVAKNNCSQNFSKLIQSNVYFVNGDIYSLINLNDINLDYFEYEMNFYRTPNSEVTLTTAKNGSINTSNVFAASFKGKTDYDYSDTYGNASTATDTKEISGYVDYDEFISSMTEEQYNEIISYLNRTNPEKDEYYYELIVKDFYGKYKVEEGTVDADGFNIPYTDLVSIENVPYFYPSTVEIVKTKKENTWYAQDEVIKSYKLTPNFDKDSYYLFTQTDDYRNVLETDFILGKYSDKNLYDELKNAMGENWKEYAENEAVFFEVSSFNYIYYKTCTTPANIEDSSDNFQTVVIRYCEKVNLLENCVKRIGLIFIYTFIMFVALGIVVWFITWHITKKQVEYEHSKREITNLMAHDLKTPLFIISGNAENLLETTNNEDEKYYAKNIINKVNSANVLIHDMLELSKFESDNFHISSEKFSLNELIDDIIQSYDSIIEINDVHFENSEEVIINADKRLIQRAIQNLLDNAFKYTDEPSSVIIRLDKNMFSISNSISNNEKLDLKKVWEPYKRLNNCTKREGNGLGLSIVRSIFELHNYFYGVEQKNDIIKFYFKF